MGGLHKRPEVGKLCKAMPSTKSPVWLLFYSRGVQRRLELSIDFDSSISGRCNSIVDHEIPRLRRTSDVGRLA